MSYAFSIAIPTYNNGHRLERLIENLRNQEGIDGLDWEILIVDNNSTDGSSQLIHELVAQAGSSGHPHLHSVCETQQGAAYARIRAMKECHSEFVAFIDDDIHPSPHWIRDGLASIRQQPRAGVVSGRVRLSPKITPFPQFEHVARLFAIEDLGNEPQNYHPHEMHMPPSAAVWVRRKAWADNVSDQPFLRGACKGFPFAGDDYEAFYQIALAGWELRYEPALSVEHELDPKRFEKPGLKRLARSIGYATYPPRLLNAKSQGEACWIALRMIARGWLLYIKQNRTYGWGNQSPVAYMKKQHSIGFACSPIIYTYFRLRKAR